MTVINKTPVTINLNGNAISPGESFEHSERAFDTANIHSDIGSCVITTEYSERKFETYGKLVAKEGKARKGDNGMKEVIISCID